MRRAIIWREEQRSVWPAKLTTYLGSAPCPPKDCGCCSLNYPLSHIHLWHQSTGCIDSEMGNEFRYCRVPLFTGFDQLLVGLPILQRGKPKKYAHQVKCCSGVYFLDQWFRKPNLSEDLIDANFSLYRWNFPPPTACLPAYLVYLW